MGSTSATLHRTTQNAATPQGYAPSTDLYKPIAVRQIGSSEYAQMFQNRGYTPFALEAITVTTSGQSLSSGTYSGAVFAEGQVLGGLVYVNSYGTAATSSGSFQAEDTDWIVLESSGEIAGFRILKGSTATTTLLMQYST